MALKRPEYSYRHPSKDEQPGGADPTARERTEQRRGSENLAPMGRSAELALFATTLPSAERVGSARRAIDITFAVPAHGALHAFSAMTEGGVEPSIAILAIGKRALRSYEDSLDTLDHAALLVRFGDPTFEHSTRRTVRAETLTHAWATLDPFGVRSGREMGRLLGRVAIQHWLEAERKLVS